MVDVGAEVVVVVGGDVVVGAAVVDDGAVVDAGGLDVEAAGSVVVVDGSWVEVVDSSVVLVGANVDDGAVAVGVGAPFAVPETLAATEVMGTRGCVTSLRTAATACVEIQTDTRVAAIQPAMASRFMNAGSHVRRAPALNHR